MRSSILFTVIICTLLSFSATFAQTNLDSLYSVWQDETKSDSSRVEAYKDYIWNGFLFSNPDSAFSLADELFHFGKESNYSKAIALGYKLQGAAFSFQSNYPSALMYFKKSLAIQEEIGDKLEIASSLNNIGSIYYYQNVYPEALEYYQRSLKLFEKIQNKEKSAAIVMNIGLIYFDQEDFLKALEYLKRSLKLGNELGDKHTYANTTMWIGNTFLELKDYSKALEYLQNSFLTREQIGDKQGSAWCLSNIGTVHQKQGNNAKAMDYYRRSLTMYEESGDKKSNASVNTLIGHLYLQQEDYPKALQYCKKALLTIQELGLLDQTNKSCCQCLYETYKAMGNGNKALVYMEKTRIIEDSLNAEETTKKLQQMEFQKQVLADSIATAEKERLVLEAHQAEVRKKNQTRNYLAGGGLLFLLLAGGLYSRNRYIKKSKDVIEKEKDRSNNLLLNILPADIAEELKIHGKAEARDFEMVSILFTDFKGFTEASAKMSAADLVNEINQCFEAFDGIIEKYKVEKIKTIGDAYMAAGGLPVPSDDSVKNTVFAALEMQAFISKRKSKMDAAGKPAFEMRVGIHTGPVVAGIVGVKKFQYDIWGDTVNTASRIENNGEAGKVNISQATYELLKSDSNFVFESRGKIEAKGKGEIEMWFVSKNN